MNLIFRQGHLVQGMGQLQWQKNLWIFCNISLIIFTVSQSWFSLSDSSEILYKVTVRGHNETYSSKSQKALKHHLKSHRYFQILNPQFLTCQFCILWIFQCITMSHQRSFINLFWFHHFHHCYGKISSDLYLNREFETKFLLGDRRQAVT